MSNTDNIWGTTLIERQTGARASVASIIAAAEGGGGGGTDPAKVTIVNAKSDFPDPDVSNVINLLDGETYLISGNINIGGDRISFGIGSAIIGSNRFTDFITYTGTDTLFTATSQHKIEEIGIIASLAQVFDLSGTTSETAVYTNSYIVSCDSVGTIHDWRTIVFRSFSVVGATTGGLTFTGDIEAFDMTNSYWSDGVAGTMLDLNGATFDRVQVLSGNRFNVLGGVTAIDGAVDNGNLNAGGRGLIEGCIFEGAGTYLNNITTQDTQWTMQGNAGIGDTSKNAQGYNHTITLTTIGTGDGNIGNPKVMSGSTNWLEEQLDQFEMTTGGRFTYKGEDSAEFHIRAVINGTAQSGTNRNFNHYLGKTGTIITASKITREYHSGNNGTVTTAAIVTLAKDDFIEVFVENISGTQNWETNIVNVIIARSD